MTLKVSHSKPSKGHSDSLTVFLQKDGKAVSGIGVSITNDGKMQVFINGKWVVVDRATV